VIFKMEIISTICIVYYLEIRCLPFQLQKAQVFIEDV
jgi:hypothetical protein